MNTWQDELRRGNFRARELHGENYEQEKNIILEWVCGQLDNILEIGCGEFPLFNDSTKIDVAKVRNDIIQIDCNQPFADKLGKKFSVIIAQYVVCHLWNIEDFFDECHKLLQDVSYLILSLPNENYWRRRLNFSKQTEEMLWHIDNKTYWRLNPASLKIIAERHGFMVEDIRPIGRSSSLTISASMLAKLRKVSK